jgi:hypothetical protein
VAVSDNKRPSAIDVKVNLMGADLPRARITFGLAEETSRRSVVYFCERPTTADSLSMLDSGIVLRLRETDENRRDAVVLLRPWWPGRLPAGWTRRLADGVRVRVAGEWTPHARVVAVSATSPVSALALAAALTGTDRLSEAFSPEQDALLRKTAPSQLTWHVLRPFGPVEIRSWTREVAEGQLCADLWTVRSVALDLLELRVVADPDDAALLLPALLALVRDHGLDPDAVTNNKTRVVLRRLAAATLGS